MGMKVNGSTGLVFPDDTTMSTGAQAVKAWVNFNGTGTVAIRAQFNVSSITDNGTGDYTVNFTTAMPNADYSVVGTVGSTTLGAGNNALLFAAMTYTTASVRMQCVISSSTGAADPVNANVAVFD
jgi:hypothetical protein